MIFKDWKSRLTAFIVGGAIVALSSHVTRAADGIAVAYKGKPYSQDAGQFDYFSEPAPEPTTPAPPTPPTPGAPVPDERTAPGEDRAGARPSDSDEETDPAPAAPSIDSALDPALDANVTADAGIDSLSADTGAASAPASAAPNMIGDFFGAITQIRGVFSGPSEQVINVASNGLTTGRAKLSENKSPLPANRVFLDFNYFDNVPLGLNGTNVKRFTPGFETTTQDGLWGLEARFPMAITLDSTFLIDRSTDEQSYEFGNIFITGKRILYQDCLTTLAAGLGVTVPTAEDFVVGPSGGEPLVVFENRSVHLTPYVAAFLKPTCSTFFQGFIQVDVDANGNPLLINDGTGLANTGRFHDQTLLQIDLGAGYWLYRNPCACCGLSGLALTSEVHYSATMNDADVAARGGITVGNIGGVADDIDDFDIVNLTFGAHVIQANGTAVTFGYGVPVSQDQVFDGELRVLLNRYF